MKTYLKSLLFGFFLLTLPSVSLFAAFPAKVFAPYVDVTIWPTFSIQAYQNSQGQNFTTLAFIVADSQGRPSWGGYHPLENKFYLEEIQAVRAGGGDVVISFGGANGTELALWHKDVSSLQAAYQSVIDTYQLSWVDFDIEGMAVAERPSIDRRNKAIRALQQANPELKVAFCLPVLPQGLTADGLYVIENAKTNGVRIDLVNVMAMDYGDSAAPNPEGNMGQYAIDAATNTHHQMLQIGVNTQIGITPMIGQNDVPSERFYVADAEKLYQWAIAPEQLPWVGMLSMWSATRDNGECPGQLSPKCSGISQQDYAFTKLFARFYMDGSGNQHPQIAITSPVDKATFDLGEAIPITAEAGDPDGTVTKVDFLLNDTQVGSVTTSPFQWTLTGVETGIHLITARAWDDKGASKTSAPIKIFVGAVCTADPWQATQAYVAGDLVSFNNHHWEAKWWTLGDEPGSGGQWGPWKDLGVCGN